MTEVLSNTTNTAHIGGRSPLSDHGILGDKGDTGVIYASWPMALARADLKPAAKAIAALIWSHAEGWELSIASLAEDSGMSRNTVSKAVEELQAARWLVRQPYGRPGKKPAGAVWHRQLTNVPFTEDEVRELSTLVPIGTGAQKLSTPGAQKLSTPGAQKVSTKVVDVLEVDLQAVQAPASLDAEPAAATEKMAEEKEEPVIPESPAPLFNDPRFDTILKHHRAHMNPNMDPVEADERARRIAEAAFADVLAQDAVIREGEERRQAAIDALPSWVTDKHKQDAKAKGRERDLPDLVANVLSQGSNVRRPAAILSIKIRELTEAPKTVVGRLWQE